MSGLLQEIQQNLGVKGDAASATGSAFARVIEFLTNRLSATRAAKIDNLDAAISALLSTGINSIQRVATVNGANTISSVNTAKTAINYEWFSSGDATGVGEQSIVLTNSTTVTVVSSGVINISVIEYK